MRLLSGIRAVISGAEARELGKELLHVFDVKVLVQGMDIFGRLGRVSGGRVG